MTTTDHGSLHRDSYPVQAAATGRFRNGLPRAFRTAPGRVVFIRSAGGRDSVGSLWTGSIVAGALSERCIVDARNLVTADGDLPEAEKARRERMRETTSGITAYSADAGLTIAVFSVDGVPYVVSLVDPDAVARELPHPGPVVDPRMSPDGRRVAYVSDRAVYVTDADGSGAPVALPSASVT